MNVRLQGLTAAAALIAAASAVAHAQTPGPYVSLSANPTANPATAQQIDAFEATKLDVNNGVAVNLQDTGGTFTNITTTGETAGNLTVNSGTIAAAVEQATVHGVTLSTLFSGLVKNTAGGVPGLDGNGLILVSSLPDLATATVNGQLLASAIAAGGSGGSGGSITDVTNLQVTVNGSKQMVGTAISAATTKANAALPAASAGPLATLAGANPLAAVDAALGYTPYNASNPAGYVTASTSPVTSVNGQTGAVTISTGANYILPKATAAALGGVSVSDGLSVSATGALSANVKSVFGRTGAVAMQLSDVTGALGYTPYNASNPAGYVTSSAVAGSAPVQSVVGQKGDVNGAQIASGLAGQNISSAIVGGGKTGNQIQAQQVGDEATISSVNTLARAAMQPSTAGAENISVNPTANTDNVHYPTVSSFSIQSTASASTKREFMVNLDLDSSESGTDKVTLYSGVICRPGSANCWGENIESQSAAGFTGSVSGIEADVANYGADAPPYTSRGIYAIGANGNINPGGNNYMSAGIGVFSAASVPIFHDGLIIANNSVKDASIHDTGGATFSYNNTATHGSATFQDSGNSPIGFSNTGNHHTAMMADAGTSNVALDLLGTYAIGAITTQYAHTTNAILVAPGQRICVSGGDYCFYFKQDPSNLYWIFTNNTNTAIMQLDNSGNLSVRGTVTQGVNIAN